VHSSEPGSADGLKTDRRILLVLTESVWPSIAVPSQRITDGLTKARRNLFFLTESVWPSSAVPSQRTADGLTMDRRILFFLTESVWPSSARHGIHSINPMVGVSRYYNTDPRQWTMDAANDDDSSAYRLLGWPIVVAAVDGANTSTSSVQSWENCNDFDAFTNNTACAGRPPPPAAHSWQADDTTTATTNNTTTNGDWLTLQFQIRTTNNGLSIFRRAMQILYSDNHTFQPSTQPTSWQWKLKGYFRLIQCALERRPEATPAAAAAAIADSTTSTTSLSEDGWEKMAIELLKRMNISLQQYLMELFQVSSDTTTTTSSITTNLK
jgi:hypothetical protein